MSRVSERPATCYACGADVEPGPRFGAEAMCDACRRNPPLVSVCSWCDPYGERTLALKAQGRDITHGICDTHRAEFEAGR